MIVGSDAEQEARLDHAIEVHGLRVVALCPGCKDRETPEGCRVCGGEGHQYEMPLREPCGPSCPFRDARLV